jgi:DNA-binding FrmR family transcriptional regulator
MSKHESHPEIVKRLKRAEGHLRTVIGMIEAGRPCVDLAQQLHAIEKAIGSAKTVLIHDHIDHCLEQTIGPQKRAERAALDEFRQLTKFL